MISDKIKIILMRKCTSPSLTRRIFYLILIMRITSTYENIALIANVDMKLENEKLNEKILL